MPWNKLKDNRGSILLMSVLIMTSVLTIALGAANLVAPGILLGRTQTRSTKAFFAAEAGAERILWEMRKNYHSPNTTDSSKFDFTNNWPQKDPDHYGPCSTTTYKFIDFNEHRCRNDKAAEVLDGDVQYYVYLKSGSGDPPESAAFVSVGEYKDIRRLEELSY